MHSTFERFEDARRTDLAVAIAKDDKSTGAVNRVYDANKVPHRYTTDLCHNLVMWAWSRDPSQIVFTDNTEEVILAKATEIGKRYNSDLYLVENNDMRYKIARVTCAVAARMFSTDEKGKKLLVKPEHVQFAADLFDRCYGRGNPQSDMAYETYANVYQERNALTTTKREAFVELVETLNDDGTIVNLLLNANNLRKKDVEEGTALEKHEVNKLWRFLVSRQFIAMWKGGPMYKKTKTFKKLLSILSSGMDPRQLDDSDTPPF